MFERLRQRLQRVSEREPGQGEARLGIGRTLQEQGKAVEAREHFAAAIESEPSLKEAHVRFCQVLAMTGSFKEAAVVVESAIARFPEDADLLYLAGNLALHDGRAGEAVAAYRHVLSLNPAHPEAHYNGGLALESLGRHAEALESFERAVALRPDYPVAQIKRAEGLFRAQRSTEAIEACDKLRAAGIESPALQNECGIALSRLGRFDAAVAAFDRAVAADAGFVEALNGRGLAQQQRMRFEEALMDFDAVVALRPDLIEVHVNRGNVQRELLRHEEALESYRKVLSVKPDFEGIYLNVGLSQLVLGRLREGWPGYEWRWKFGEGVGRERSFVQPRWRGDSPLAGKTILLHAEQGLGDTIQFCRYAKPVAERGATVLLEVQPQLKALLSTLEGVDRVLATGEELPPFDVHCPLLSLPLAFATELSTIPSPDGYLHRVPSRAERASLLMPESRRAGVPRVGLVWSGNPHHRNDANRSIPLEQFASALVPDIEFVCLQNAFKPGDRRAADRLPQIHFIEAALVDFEATAAVVAEMDLVISVDTSVAHLAAAMGKPTWILLPFNPDWRWLLQREDSPWYRSARLFRQSRRGDWGSALAKVHDGLRALAGQDRES